MTTKIPAELSSTPGITDSSNATAITIDSSEKVGIGETSPLGTLHVKTADSGASADSGADELVLENSGDTGMTIMSGTSNSGSIRFGDSADNDNGIIIYNHGSSPYMRFFVDASERVRIDSSGKVGIGLTSPAAVLDIKSSGTTSTAFRVVKSDAGQNLHAMTEISGHGRFSIYDASENEDIRFDSNGNSYFNGGNVGIATSSPAFNLEVQESSASTYAARFMHTGNPNSGPPQIMRLDFWNTPNNGTSEFLKCRDTVSGTAVNRAVIMSNGGIGNFTTNDFNYSDERMKKDISNATAQLDNIKKLQLKTFRYKEQEDSEPTNLGVVAQDIQSDFPTLVTEQGEGDEARLGVKEQQIMWMAVKAIQEQQDIIEDLKSRIEALEE